MDMQQVRMGSRASVRQPRSRRRCLDSRQAATRSQTLERRRHSSPVWTPVSRLQECRHSLPLFLGSRNTSRRPLALGNMPARPLSSKAFRSHPLVSRRVEGLGRHRLLCLASPRRREQALHSRHTSLALLPVGLPSAALQSGHTPPTRHGRDGSTQQVGLAIQEAALVLGACNRICSALAICSRPFLEATCHSVASMPLLQTVLFQSGAVVPFASVSKFT